ncbi:efflux RND transporter periplasmic adaptor subunit [Devosia aquimaris]|uniref:efflux RND transporter periplasmic adaptor subunit n=1 Tax=Devosia aquimaris TaxID=2866214 RepID=UPI001CD0E57E|nr:efflux RND transporter periplasmic adaptor subunit [Devosia sp. CJK-A8-3]
MSNILPGGRRRNVRSVLFAVAAIAAVGLGAWFYVLRPTDSSAEMETAEVTRGDIEQAILASGTLEPSKMVNVGAQVSGQVKKLHVALGQRIAAGTLVAEIDSLPQQNALKIAETSLASVRAQRDARIASLGQAEATFERQKGLLESNATSRTDYEAAKSARDVVKAEIASLDAQVERAMLEVDIAKLNLGYTRIVTPIDGVVISVVTKEGQTLNAAQTVPTVVVVAQMDTMSVKVQISEADVDKVKAGQELWFTLLGDSRRRFDGKLDAVEPAPISLTTQTVDGTQAANPTAIYFNGLFKVDNPDGRLRPLMTAQVHIVVARAKDVITVPSGALSVDDEDGMRTVTVLNADGTTVARRVRIGVDDKVNAEVIEGLQPGEKIVLATAAEAPVDTASAGEMF